MTSDNATGQPFHTTRWSLVMAAGREDEQRQRALAELCAIYWPPVYALWNNDIRTALVGGEDSISNLHTTPLVGSVRT